MLILIFLELKNFIVVEDGTVRLILVLVFYKHKCICVDSWIGALM